MARLTASGFASQWKARAVGEMFLIPDDIGEAPPPSVAGMRFVKLTANQNGPGQYNEGALINEEVNGSGALLEAVAEINAPGGLVHGKIINLINTENRYLGPGENAGEIGNDEMQLIEGEIGSVLTHSSVAGGAFKVNSRGFMTYEGAGDAGFNVFGFDSSRSPGARTGDRTKPKSRTVSAYMRVA